MPDPCHRSFECGQAPPVDRPKTCYWGALHTLFRPVREIAGCKHAILMYVLAESRLGARMCGLSWYCRIQRDFGCWRAISWHRPATMYRNPLFCRLENWWASECLARNLRHILPEIGLCLCIYPVLGLWTLGADISLLSFYGP
jgi:hypothetical protein